MELTINVELFCILMLQCLLIGWFLFQSCCKISLKDSFLNVVNLVQENMDSIGQQLK